MSKLRARPFLTENVVTDPPKCGLKTRLLRSNSGGSHNSLSGQRESQTLHKNISSNVDYGNGLASRTLQLTHCNGKAGKEMSQPPLQKLSVEVCRNGSLKDTSAQYGHSPKRRSPSASDIYGQYESGYDTVTTKSNSSSDIYAGNGNAVIYGQQLRGKNIASLYRTPKGSALRVGSEPTTRRFVGSSVGGNHSERKISGSHDHSDIVSSNSIQQSNTGGIYSGNNAPYHYDRFTGKDVTTGQPTSTFPSYLETRSLMVNDPRNTLSRSAEMDNSLRGNQVCYPDSQYVGKHIRSYNERKGSRSDSSIVSGPINTYSVMQSTQRVVEPHIPISQRTVDSNEYMSHASSTSLGTSHSLGTAMSEPIVKFASRDRSPRAMHGERSRYEPPDTLYRSNLSHTTASATVQDQSMVNFSQARNFGQLDTRPFGGRDIVDGTVHSRFEQDTQPPVDLSMQYMHTTKTHGTLSNVPLSPDSYPYDQPTFDKISPPDHMLLKDSFSSDSSSPGISSTSFETDESVKGISALRTQNIRSMDPTDVATRLYTLEGFDSDDIAPFLGKNNDFSQQVCREYLQFFNFEGLSLDDALRQFLGQFPLTGETQERERILIHFSKRFYECNRPPFASEDAIHTLTCALMLLNTDLHGQTIGNKMNLNEFITNLSGLCDEKDFPRELLKTLYQSIRNRELVFSGYEKRKEKGSPKGKRKPSAPGNPFVQLKVDNDAVVLKEGLMYRKCVMEADGRKTPAIKRGWKLYYGVLKGLVLFLYKPEQVGPEQAVTIGIHHALAGYAAEYKKRPFVYKIITADWRVFMFQAKSKHDAQEWVDALNLSASALSSPPLPAPVSSSKRFQRPVMPVSVTRLNVDDQAKHHQGKVQAIENDMKEHREQHPGETAKEIREWESKIDYLEFEHKRFLTYVSVLSSARLKDKLQLLLSKNGVPSNKTSTHALKRSTSLGELATPSKSSPKIDRKNSKLRESYLMAVSN